MCSRESGALLEVSDAVDFAAVGFSIEATGFAHLKVTKVEDVESPVVGPKRTSIGRLSERESMVTIEIGGVIVERFANDHRHAAQSIGETGSGQTGELASVQARSEPFNGHLVANGDAISDSDLCIGSGSESQGFAGDNRGAANDEHSIHAILYNSM